MSKWEVAARALFIGGLFVLAAVAIVLTPGGGR